MNSGSRAGAASAALAFVMWGLFPLYFRQVAAVSPLEIILHRSVWSLVFVGTLLALLGRWDWLRLPWRAPRDAARYALTALLLAANWLIYVWAVNHDEVVEASLGYYINPLVNVLLGVTLLGETLRRAQWLAVALAAAGVLWLTWHGGRLPWIALALGFSFGVYGLLRKTASLGALEGLALETLLLAPLALPALLWWTFMHDGALARGDLALTGWLLLSGPLSATPLVLFAAGARRLPLAIVGLIQYVSPTLQLLLGLWVFGEPFDRGRLAGFVLIWAALALVSVDALARARPAATAAAPSPRRSAAD